MQFKRPDRAAFGLRAQRRGFARQESKDALLTIYFGLDMCSSYIHNAIKQDMEEDYPGFLDDDLPTLTNLMSISKEQTSNIAQCRAMTLVDQHATKVLVEVE